MRNLHFVRPRRFILAAPSRPSVTPFTDHWGGYIDDRWRNDEKLATEVDDEFNMAYVASNQPCLAPELSQWVGIGGDGADGPTEWPFAQAGILTYWTKGVPGQVFWEGFNPDGKDLGQDLGWGVVKPGENVQASVAQTSGGFEWSVWDYPSNWTEVGFQSLSGWNGDTAEAIMEARTDKGYDVAKFSSPNLWQNFDVNNLPTIPEYEHPTSIRNSSQAILAHPGGLWGPSNNNFDMYYDGGCNDG